jgi:uncharacterized heparinase superfamily protein
VSLAGLEWSIELPIDWHNVTLDHGSRLERLTLHYMEYLEDISDETVEGIIADWIEQCPPYQPSYWLGEWNSYALSIRVVVWMQQIARRDLSTEFLTRARQSLADQIRFLVRNLELDIGGNHLIKNIKALYWASAFFQGEEARGWGSLAQKHLIVELERQVLSDGTHFELSPAYHAQVFGDLLETYAVCRNLETSAVLEDTLQNMASALACFTHPDGRISLFGDGGLDMVYSPKVLLGTYQKLTGGTARLDCQVHLPAAGYHGYQDENFYLLIDAGSTGPRDLPGHAHSDGLSFEFDLWGERVLVDPGTFEYHDGGLRGYLRSTAAHNTVTVEGRDQSETYGSFRVARRGTVSGGPLATSGLFRFHGTCVDFRKTYSHQRLVELDPHSLRVVDDIALKTARGGAWTISWLLHPSWKATPEEGQLRLTSPTRSIVMSSTHTLRHEQSDWYPNFGEVAEAVRVVCSGSASDQVSTSFKF